MIYMFRGVLVICLFMIVSGLLLSEMLLAFVLPQLSVRVLVFALSALICWLLLDNVTLAADLAHATASTSTEGERHLLRSLLFSSRKRALIHSLLDGEIASHRETVLKLDLLLEKSSRATLTALHWSLLASKTIVMSNLQQMQHRHPELPRSHSSGWIV